MGLERQVAGEAKLEYCGADGIGDDDSHMLALPEGGAALLHRCGGAHQRMVGRGVPIGQLDAVPVGDKGAVMQMEMINGDFSSLGWRPGSFCRFR